jgi:hypothetical protein
VFYFRKKQKQGGGLQATKTKTAQQWFLASTNINVT